LLAITEVCVLLYVCVCVCVCVCTHVVMCSHVVMCTHVVKLVKLLCTLKFENELTQINLWYMCSVHVYMIDR